MYKLVVLAIVSGHVCKWTFQLCKRTQNKNVDDAFGREKEERALTQGLMSCPQTLVFALVCFLANERKALFNLKKNVPDKKSFPFDASLFFSCVIECVTSSGFEASSIT